jgi:hypothetical protein
MMHECWDQLPLFKPLPKAVASLEISSSWLSNKPPKFSVLKQTNETLETLRGYSGRTTWSLNLHEHVPRYHQLGPLLIYFSFKLLPTSTTLKKLKRIFKSYCMLDRDLPEMFKTDNSSNSTVMTSAEKLHISPQLRTHIKQRCNSYVDVELVLHTCEN